jgi:hypothetical protein
MPPTLMLLVLSTRPDQRTAKGCAGRSTQDAQETRKSVVLGCLSRKCKWQKSCPPDSFRHSKSADLFAPQAGFDRLMWMFTRRVALSRDIANNLMKDHAGHTLDFTDSGFLRLSGASFRLPCSSLLKDADRLGAFPARSSTLPYLCRLK